MESVRPTIIDGPEAVAIATDLCPTWYQEWETILDFWTSVQTGPVVIVRGRLSELIESPELYFRVMRGGCWLYGFYMKYIPFDWTDSRCPLLQELDSHRHDTESVLVRRHVQSGRRDLATVNHRHFLFESKTDGRVTIESQSHAIWPYRKRPVAPDKRVTIYTAHNCKLVNLDDLPAAWWADVRRSFAGQANLPDELYDEAMIRSASGQLHNKRGDIFNRPDRLFAAATLKSWIE